MFFYKNKEKLYFLKGKLIGNGKYTEIGNLLIEIGKMLGGWKKGMDIKKT